MNNWFRNFLGLTPPSVEEEPEQIFVATPESVELLAHELASMIAPAVADLLAPRVLGSIERKVEDIQNAENLRAVIAAAQRERMAVN